MSFTFSTGIPAAGNNPSVDQPDLQTNNVSIDGILATDHISFNTTGGGKHKQVTFASKNTPAAQTDPQSVLYTGNGVASTVSQMYFANQNATFPVSAVRVFCSFVSVPNASTPTFLTSYNVVSVAARATNKYTFTLTTGALTGTSVAVYTTTSGSSSVTYNVVSATVFELTYSSAIAADTLSFMILQI